MNDITIRRAETPADYRALQDVQRRAWGITEESYIVPVATMVGAQLHGGLVLGAYLPNGEAVGLSFAFLGRIEGRICLYSQLTGVVPDYQSIGLGARLKYAQREVCVEEHIPVIAWAFDPLQAGNANFNLMKLGAFCRRILPDMYGPRTDALNQRLPTDRLIAEWEVDAIPPSLLTEQEAREWPHVLIRPLLSNESTFESPRIELPEGPSILLEIPCSISDMRQNNPHRARHWQALVTSALTACFAQGYRVTRFIRMQEPDELTSRCYYVVDRRENVATR